jgi:hypothetical protein
VKEVTQQLPKVSHWLLAVIQAPIYQLITKTNVIHFNYQPLIDGAYPQPKRFPFGSNIKRGVILYAKTFFLQHQKGVAPDFFYFSTGSPLRPHGFLIYLLQ